MDNRRAASSPMLSFDIAGCRVQFRAAAVIIEDGHVLLHRPDGDDVWALPGGRVEAGEAASTAIVREMQEEVAEKLELGELLFTVENFFEHNGTRNHEIGFYFHSALSPGSRIRSKHISHRGIEGEKALEFRWFPIVELAEINLRPIFLRTALAEYQLGHRHIVQAD